jgi:hypothetical protein
MTPTEVVLLVLAVVVLIAATIAIARALSSVGDERVPAASDPGDSRRDILSVDLTDRNHEHQP